MFYFVNFLLAWLAKIADKKKSNESLNQINEIIIIKKNSEECNIDNPHSTHGDNDDDISCHRVSARVTFRSIIFAWQPAIDAIHRRN